MSARLAHLSVIGVTCFLDKVVRDMQTTLNGLSVEIFFLHFSLFKAMYFSMLALFVCDWYQAYSLLCTVKQEFAELQNKSKQKHLLKNLEGSIFAWLVGWLVVWLSRWQQV